MISSPSHSRDLAHAVDVFGYYIDHNHDDRYYTKNQTTDVAAEARALEVVHPPLPSAAVGPYSGFTFVPNITFTFSRHDFATSTAGRLQVAKSVFLSSVCANGASEPRIFFLILDGQPIESSAVFTRDNNPINHLFGVTEDVIPAGDHSITVGVDCLNGGGGAAPDEAYSQASIVVLPAD